jgi:type IV pilus assembly protein PilP
VKRLFTAFLFAVILWSPSRGWVQEEKGTPSQKTREAVEKLKKAQAAATKGLETLKEAGRAKLLGPSETKKPTKVEQDSMTLPTKKPEQSEAPRYSPAGKRDPFRPLALKTKAGSRPRENLSPLERYEIGQLTLVGIVWDISEPRAMVEDATGLGYIVKVGTPIGTNDGKVKAIKPTEVVIVEIHTDFYGERKSREVSMKLPAEQ